MGNIGAKQSHISEGCKYYAYYNGHLLTVCCFNYRQPNQWFQSIYLRNPKLLSIKGRYGSEYQSHGTLKVGHCVHAVIQYYTTSIAAYLNLSRYVHAEHDIINNYQPVGKMFVLYESDEHHNPVAKYLVDSARSGIIIADRIDGKWQFRE